MEKLQAALEKARAARAEEIAEEPVPAPAEAVSDDAEDTVAEPDGWSDLPEISLSPRRGLRHRLFLRGDRAEAAHFDKLRTKILQQCQDNGWKRVVITSATKNCGKTMISCNLAASFARQRDRKVMLLDLDMRRPEIARVFEQKPRRSFADVLEDNAAFAECAARLGESVAIGMNAGPHPNPSQILLQDRTPEIIDELEAQYSPDLIILDTPPMLASDDTMSILKLADCAVIVAAAELTTTDQVDLVEKEVAGITNVVGVVLNRCIYLDDVHSYYYR